MATSALLPLTPHPENPSLRIDDPPKENPSQRVRPSRIVHALDNTLTADLALHIRRIIASRGLTPDLAALFLGMTPKNLSTYLKHIKPNRLALLRLLQCLNALGSDVEITVKPADKERGEISLTCGSRPVKPAPGGGLLSAPAQLVLAHGEAAEPLNARLAEHIRRTLDRRGITRTQAASLFTIFPQNVSSIHLRPRKFGLHSLLHFLNLLNFDVEITVTPTCRARGKIFLTIL